MKFLSCKTLLAFFIVLLTTLAQAQSLKIYPTNWWVGMKWHQVQLMLHDTTGLAEGNENVTVSYPGVKILKVTKGDSKNYLFVDIDISAAAKPGTMSFLIKSGSSTKKIAFELKARRRGNGALFAQGVTASDFIYLLMPDRFSNGDYSNDRLTGMRDQSLNRDSIYDRHGGDLEGVINHIDYLKQLGVTSVWMTPVIQNDMPNRTEHGYAFTDHYQIEPRFGGNEAYKTLSDSLHKNGLKLIQDAVYNHVGIQHFFFRDKPFKDWFHEWPTFTNPNYKDQTIFDPHAAEVDKRKMLNGWFTTEMPDLNQSNPFVAKFLIQHALWSVEEFGVDGWRIDTYIYVDQPFMNSCNQALLDEYPKISLFGEAWVGSTVDEAFFTRNNYNIPFKSNIPGVCDFQTLFSGIIPALKNPKDGVMRMYETLSNDFLYKDAMTNVIFLDNHDITRFLTEVNDDTAKLKMGIAWLLTCRGIPEMYYGTEILMKGSRDPYDGNVRHDFPGGWKEDPANKFTQAGRTPEENSLFNWTSALANFRKNAPAIKSGKLLQYIPENGVYVYFRYTASQTIMCVMNTGDAAADIDLARFTQGIGQHKSGMEITTGKSVSLQDKLSIPGKYMYVLDLK